MNEIGSLYLICPSYTLTYKHIHNTHNTHNKKFTIIADPNSNLIIEFRTRLTYIPERQSLGAAREEVLGRIRHIEEQGHQQDTYTRPSNR